MTISINQYANSGNLSSVQTSVKSLTQQEKLLSEETSSGVISQSYAGLGDGRAQALNLNPQITAISTWQNSITSAQNKLTVTQSALTEISSIASDLSVNMMALKGDFGKEQLSSSSQEAASALSTLSNLLNTSDGSGYVFAGVDSQVAPVANESAFTSGNLMQGISSLVSNLSSAGGDSVFQDATSLATGTGSYASYSVFSSELSVTGAEASTQQSVAVIGANMTTSVGMVATEGDDATSTSTGSPIKDLIRNLMIVASLGDADTSTSGFSDLVSNLVQSTSQITTDITTEQGKLGIAQNQLSDRSTYLTTISTQLSTKLSSITSADLATVSVQTTQISKQLQASYSLIASMKGMSLASYL